MIVVDLPPWLLGLFLFALGSIVGSFLNVCIYRLPMQDGFRDSLNALWREPSHCRRCQTRIRWYDNIPIAGWLHLRGRCRSCRAWISPRYPFVELLNGLLFVWLYWCEIGFGFSVPLTGSTIYSEMGPQAVPGLGSLSFTTFELLRYGYHLILIDALLVASFIDIDLRIIPDGSTLPAMAAGLVGAAAVGRLNVVPVWFQQPSLLIVRPLWVPAWISNHPHLHGLAVSVAGLIVGGGLVWLIRLLGQWALREEAMGFGDVVLMAVIGSYLGWQPTVMAFFVAPAIALAVVLLMYFVRYDRVIPFGPYLSLAALAMLVFWRELWPIGERLFGLGPVLIPMAVVGLLLLALCLLVARGLRQLLGIRPVNRAVEPWTAADQNLFFAGHVDSDQSRWPRGNTWPGIRAGRGQAHARHWRGQ